MQCRDEANTLSASAKHLATYTVIIGLVTLVVSVILMVVVNYVVVSMAMEEKRIEMIEKSRMGEGLEKVEVISGSGGVTTEYVD